MNTNTGIHRKMREVIRSLGYQYDEEYNVPNTKFYIDFYLPEFNLGVEVDGPSHILSRKRDEERDQKIFRESAIPIVRYDYNFMMNKLEKISTALDDAILKLGKT